MKKTNNYLRLLTVIALISLGTISCERTEIEEEAYIDINSSSHDDGDQGGGGGGAPN